MQSSSSGVHDSFRHLNCSMSNSNKHSIGNDEDDEEELIMMNRRRCEEEYSSGMNLLKRSAVEAALDHHHHHHHHNDAATDVGMSSDEDSSEDNNNKPPSSSSDASATKKTPPPNGKKTKGRVKIKMEFIDNKLRRYTTFSKRKTGIMKKAYELSTLTGTQVMLLVASETGHVYTFATRKLQPMITSEAGKALIQTCLNSPDPLLNCGSSDQRMSATGFEETEFTYSIADDDPKMEMLKSQGLYVGGVPQHGETDSNQSPSYVDMSSAAFLSAAAAAAANSVATSKSGNISMQLPTATGFNTILAPSLTNSNHHSSNTDTLTRNTVTVVPTSQQGLSMVSGNMVNLTPVSTTTASPVPGTVMYQTPQGVVYATPTSATLPEGVIFNFGQLSHDAGGGGSSQQYITIPVSLTSNQIVHGIGSGTSLAHLDGSGRSTNSVTDLSKSGVKCSQVVIPACVSSRSVDAENAAKKLLAQSEVSKIR